MNGRFNRTGVAIAAALGIAMLAPTALAQTQPAAPPQAPAQNAAAQPNTGPAPSDAEIKNFAGAVVDVQHIQQSMQPELAAAKTPDARTKLQQSAEKEMEAAVQSHQLTPQRYVQIATLAQTDDSVRAKIQKLLPAPPQPSQS